MARIGAPKSTAEASFRTPLAFLPLIRGGGPELMCYYCGAPGLTCHLWYRPPSCHLFSTYRLPFPLSSIQLPSLLPHGTSSACRPLVSYHVSLFPSHLLLYSRTPCSFLLCLFQTAWHSSADVTALISSSSPPQCSRL
jgi:hypothetical protein